MQARVHGLSSSLVSDHALVAAPPPPPQQIMSHVPGPALNHAAVSSLLSPPPSASPVGGGLNLQVDLGTLSFGELDDLMTVDVGLEDILMDDSGADPLLSSGPSKTSSRRSSFSMEEDL